ncbi:SDR family NAD(P)-dependent oxidoreductase [Streptomyces armeniacus]|uniref:SDR family NAD(P)-dependent oxidoreductase n=1 Tax=Streptomyces armeniacus TaxID=83291 RepID=A0A345XVG9_9ACTN|nr:type I polyketide synthase [Streptomyces armeniacus]AXK35635.1 SDR family NAD(P)-dependent oxidoreductase [Streptomyces armeniacus]
MAASGLSAAGHPLLGAATALPDGGHMFVGRLSRQAQPWLADHSVLESVILPGSAFVELALHAGARTGSGHVAELTVEAPLVLPNEGAVQLHVTVAAPQEDSDDRLVTIHSRPADAEDDEPWTRHASGTLAAEPVDTAADLGDTQPPAEAEAIHTDALYQRLEDLGLVYGPLFQGLRRAWRHGDNLYAEVELPEQDGTAPTGYGLHPALLDATLHALALGTGGRGSESGEDEATRLPFFWGGVSLYASGATTLRARLSPTGTDAVRLALADAAGAPVASVDSLMLRPVTPEQLGSGANSHRNALFQLAWEPYALPQTGVSDTSGWMVLGEDGHGFAHRTDINSVTDAPEVLLLPCLNEPDDAPHEAAHAATEHVLRTVQDYLTHDELADTRLVILTQGAVATKPEEDVRDLAAAAVWGLIRTAQNENPDRLLLIDTDSTDASWDALRSAVGTGENQLALRDGTAHTPRLVRPAHESGETPALNPDGTVLITGATGTLGTHLTRHLVETYGARHLLLTSRSGPNAPGATELHAELKALGAHVTITACDTADRDALASLLDTVPDAHPLTAVFHTAGVLDDTTLTNLTPERLHPVLRPKIDAAWHLHTLTQDKNLTAFVLYSSIAGTLGNPGQANYAAANTFLDALAHHRHTQHQPATSLAWGLWTDSAMAEGITRTGITPLTTPQGLALLDTALATDHPTLTLAQLDTTTLRAQAAAGPLPSPLRGLIRGTVREAAATTAPLAQRLAGRSEAEQYEIALDVVRTQISAALKLAATDPIHVERGLLDMGFDSLTALELRNRLNTLTGLRLPPTLVFDHPTPAALARLIRNESAPQDGGHTTPGTNGTSPESDSEAEIRRIVASIPPYRLREAGLIELLTRLAAEGDPAAAPATAVPGQPAAAEAEDRASALQTADVDALVQMALANDES